MKSIYIEPRNDFMVAFSAYENGALLFKRNENSSTSMGCINAIRVLSIVWVIYAHSHMITALGPLTNAADLLQVITIKYKCSIIIYTILSSGLIIHTAWSYCPLTFRWTAFSWLAVCWSPGPCWTTWINGIQISFINLVYQMHILESLLVMAKSMFSGCTFIDTSDWRHR